MKTLWIVLVLVDQFICRLCGTHFMIPNLVVLVLHTQGTGSLCGCRVAAVIESMSLPGGTTYFHPFNFIIQVFPGGHITNIISLPVAAPFAQTHNSIGSILT